MKRYGLKQFRPEAAVAAAEAGFVRGASPIGGARHWPETTKPRGVGAEFCVIERSSAGEAGEQVFDGRRMPAGAACGQDLAVVPTSGGIK